MAKIIPLFSSSKGNSYYICGNNEAILVDAGRNCKQLELAMLSAEIDIKTIKAIFVTHEHIDHCSALRVFAKRYDLPIYASQGTLDALINSNKVDSSNKLCVIDDEIAVGDTLVKRVVTSHDASESCGYFITTADNRRCSVVTDTGFLTQSALTALNSSNMAVIESNHDLQMLKTGPYPYILKQRVMSMTGHLSNDDCAKVLPSLVENGTTRLLLAHLSQENNTVRLALDTSVKALLQSGMRRDSDYTITTAPVEYNGKSIVF